MSDFNVYSAPPQQKVKLIGTHDGEFHCDEALACALLKRTPEFKEAHIIRTRNKEYLAVCDVIVDVGAEYDPDRLRFDHHQISFQGTMKTTENEYKTRLSSAGLIYKHYGRLVVKQLLGDEVSEEDVDGIYDRVYRNFIEHLDGNDNGVEPYSLSKEDTDVELIQNYQVTTTLPSRVRKLGTSWNEERTAEKDAEGFKKAMALTESEFVDCVLGYAKSWLPARIIVAQSFDTRLSIHESGRIMKLDVPCPWQEHIYDLEAKHNLEGLVYYVLYPDNNNHWRVQCVGVKGTRFTNRKSLQWKGARDDELSNVSGIPDGIFVHATGFIGGNKTYDGALKMAIKSLEA